MHVIGLEIRGGALGSPPRTDCDGEIAGKPPRVLSLRVVPKRFKASRFVGRGAALRFRLDHAGEVRARFFRLLPGRRSRGRCVAASRPGARGRRCTRRIAAGVLTGTGRRSAKSLRFGGWVHRTATARRARRLAPGRYRVTMRGVAGGKTSRPRSASFTVRGAAARRDRPTRDRARDR
jgi:hypothetical protein